MSVHRFGSSAQTLEHGSLAERMERLRSDASAVAVEHTNAFVQALVDAAALAEQVAGGGEAYDVGVREIARRAHADLTTKVLSLRAIRERIH
jgi:hypothetical protein